MRGFAEVAVIMPNDGFRFTGPFGPDVKSRLLLGLANCGVFVRFEEFRAEPQTAPLGHRKISLHGHVHVMLAGSARNANTAIAEARVSRPASVRRFGRYRKCIRVEIAVEHSSMQRTVSGWIRSVRCALFSKLP